MTATTDRVVIDTETAYVSKTHAFGFKDAKGREIGAIVTTWNRTYRAWDEGRDSKYGFYIGLEAGRLYRIVTVHASRDGKTFGACQPRRHFNTDEEAAAYVAKYLKDARQRAAKIAATA